MREKRPALPRRTGGRVVVVVVPFTVFSFARDHHPSAEPRPPTPTPRQKLSLSMIFRSRAAALYLYPRGEDPPAAERSPGFHFASLRVKNRVERGNVAAFRRFPLPVNRFVRRSLFFLSSCSLPSAPARPPPPPPSSSAFFPLVPPGHPRGATRRDAFSALYEPGKRTGFRRLSPSSSAGKIVNGIGARGFRMEIFFLLFFLPFFRVLFSPLTPLSFFLRFRSPFFHSFLFYFCPWCYACTGNDSVKAS